VYVCFENMTYGRMTFSQVDAGETPETALCRELQEELSIQVSTAWETSVKHGKQQYIVQHGKHQGCSYYLRTFSYFAGG